MTRTPHANTSRHLENHAGARPQATAAQLLAISPSSREPRLSVQGGRPPASPALCFISSPRLTFSSPSGLHVFTRAKGAGRGSTRSRVRDEVPATLLRVLVCLADLLRLSRPCMSATRYRVMVQYRSQVFRQFLRLDLRTTHQPSLSGKCTSS